MSPITLSDKTELQPGTFISLPSGPMARDPVYYSDPDTFKADRFYQNNGLSSETSTVTPNDLTSIEPGNLAWGSGRFTCPGRWYASAEMKLIIAVILTRYDLRLPIDQESRLPNWYFDDATQPSRKQEILLRRRI